MEENWRLRALCGGMKPEQADRLFFPDNMSGRHVAAGKRFCQACPVARDCAEYAIGAGVKDGLFGGLTPAERKKKRVDDGP